MNFNSLLGASVTEAIFDLYKERVKWEKSINKFSISKTSE